MMGIDLDTQALVHLVTALNYYEQRERLINGSPGMHRSMVALRDLCTARLQRDSAIRGQEWSELAETLRTLQSGPAVPVMVVGIDEAADVLSVSASSVRRLITRDELPTVVIGGRRLIRVADLERYVNDLPGKEIAA